MGDLEVCKWQFTAYVSFWLHYKFPTIHLHAGPTTFADQNTAMKDNEKEKKSTCFGFVQSSVLSTRFELADTYSRRQKKKKEKKARNLPVPVKGCNLTRHPLNTDCYGGS